MQHCWAVSDLSPISACSQLIKLHLADSHLLRSEALAPLSACVQLEDLYLKHCRLINDLRHISTLVSVRTLNISSCHGVSSLAPLRGLTNLTDLYIGGFDAVDLHDFLRDMPAGLAVEDDDDGECPGCLEEDKLDFEDEDEDGSKGGLEGEEEYDDTPGTTPARQLVLCWCWDWS
jgi:hypothetical protein